MKKTRARAWHAHNEAAKIPSFWFRTHGRVEYYFWFTKDGKSSLLEWKENEGIDHVEQNTVDFPSYRIKFLFLKNRVIVPLQLFLFPSSALKKKCLLKFIITEKTCIINYEPSR